MQARLELRALRIRRGRLGKFRDGIDQGRRKRTEFELLGEEGDAVASSFRAEGMRCVVNQRAESWSWRCESRSSAAARVDSFLQKVKRIWDAPSRASS
jgi:hypothetical protein